TIPQPTIELWPAPGEEFTFYQLTTYTQRYIEDVGTLRQEIEVPQSWRLAIMARLAGDVALEDEEVDPQLAIKLNEIGENEWNRAMDGQTDGAPVYLRP